MSTTTDQAELVDRFDEFLRAYYHESIAELAQQFPKESKSLQVDWMDLFQADPALIDDLRDKPGQIQSHLEEAVENYDLPVDTSFDGVHVRVSNTPAQHIYPVGRYRSDQIGEFLGVRGQIKKQTDVVPRPRSAAFECQRCGTFNRIAQTKHELQEPHECKGCERQGPFKLDPKETDWVDFQLLRLQLPPEQCKGGGSPTIDIYVEDDLVNTTDVGDRIVASGELTVDNSDTDDATFAPRLDTHSIIIEETDYEDIDIDEHAERIEALAAGEEGDPYEILSGCIGPDIHGMETIKLALAMQLFGGVRIENPDGPDDRGDPHVLLLGDPGTAKSSLLEDVSEIAPRSTFASGKGAKAAGMTAAAVRDDFGDQEWTLKAGALVEADKGIACIDEIDKVDDDAISSLHGALSRQRVNINKAGMNTHLPTRTTLLAAGNPEYGRFRPDQPVAEQIELGPTLLSRFDLMFMVNDQPDAEQDAEIIEGMIESRTKGARRQRTAADSDSSRPVETEILRAWVAHAKQNIVPVIEDPDVGTALKESFHKLRQVNGEGEQTPVPVTFRKLEGLMRLAEASARIRLSDTIEMEDINRAKELIGASMRQVGMDPDTGQFDADIVETGTAASQKDRIDWVRSFINENEGVDAVGHETIVEAGAEADMSRGDIEYGLKKLKKKGEIYESETEYYRMS